MLLTRDREVRNGMFLQWAFAKNQPNEIWQLAPPFLDFYGCTRHLHCQPNNCCESVSQCTVQSRHIIAIKWFPFIVQRKTITKSFIELTVRCLCKLCSKSSWETLYRRVYLFFGQCAFVLFEKLSVAFDRNLLGWEVLFFSPVRRASFYNQNYTANFI